MAFSTQNDFLTENVHIPFRKKSEIKLKTYDSCTDSRAWSNDDSVNAKYLKEMVTYSSSEGGDGKTVLSREVLEEMSPKENEMIKRESKFYWKSSQKASRNYETIDNVPQPLKTHIHSVSEEGQDLEKIQRRNKKELNIDSISQELLETREKIHQLQAENSELRSLLIEAESSQVEVSELRRRSETLDIVIKDNLDLMKQLEQIEEIEPAIIKLKDKANRADQLLDENKKMCKILEKLKKREEENAKVLAENRILRNRVRDIEITEEEILLYKNENYQLICQVEDLKQKRAQAKYFENEWKKVIEELKRKDKEIQDCENTIEKCMEKINQQNYRLRIGEQRLRELYELNDDVEQIREFIEISHSERITRQICDASEQEINTELQLEYRKEVGNTEEIVKLRHDIKDYQNQIKLLEDQLEECNKSLTEMREEQCHTDTVLETNIDNDILDLTTSVTSSKINQDEVLNSVTEAIHETFKQQISVLQSQISICAQEKQELGEQLADISSKLQEEIKAKTDAIAKAQIISDKLEIENSENVSDAQAQINTFLDKIKDLEEEKNELIIEADKLRKKRDEQQKEIERLQNDGIKLQNKKDEEQNEQHEFRNEVTKSQNVKDEELIEKHEITNEVIKSQNEKNEEQNKQYEFTNEATELQNERIAENKEDEFEKSFVNIPEILKIQIIMLEKKIDDLETEKEELINEATKLHDEKDDLEKKKDECQKEKSDLHAEKEQLEKQIDLLNETIDTFRTKIEVNTEENSDSLNEINVETLKKENEILTMHLNNLRNKLTGLESDMEHLRNEKIYIDEKLNEAYGTIEQFKLSSTENLEIENTKIKELENEILNLKYELQIANEQSSSETQEFKQLSMTDILEKEKIEQTEENQRQSAPDSTQIVIINLEQENMELRAQNDQLKQELKRAFNKNDIDKRQVINEQESYNAIKDDTNFRIQLLHQLKEQEKKQIIQKYETEMEKLKSDMNVMKNDLKEVDERCRCGMKKTSHVFNSNERLIKISRDVQHFGLDPCTLVDLLYLQDLTLKAIMDKKNLIKYGIEHPDQIHDMLQELQEAFLDLREILDADKIPTKLRKQCKCKRSDVTVDDKRRDTKQLRLQPKEFTALPIVSNMSPKNQPKRSQPKLTRTKPMETNIIFNHKSQLQRITFKPPTYTSSNLKS